MPVASHFTNSAPAVLSTYQQLLKTVRTLDPVVEDRLEKPADVDRQLTRWLKAAYVLSGR